MESRVFLLKNCFSSANEMIWLTVWLVLLAIVHFPITALALTELDNSLVSEPEIRCNSDTIEMRFRTKHKFTGIASKWEGYHIIDVYIPGKIYVQGHYSNPDCRVDYSQTNSQGAPIGGIRLQHGACDMDRRRMISSGSMGMQFSAVLMISFHPVHFNHSNVHLNVFSCS